MTDIVDVARRVQYAGNGSAGPFSFSFQVNATTEIKVYVDTTLKTLTTHYTVTLTSSGAGSISFTSGNYPSSSETITIVSSVGLARSSVYTTGGPLTATALETDFDTNIMILQQSSQKVDRALAAPEYDSTSINMTLPAKDSRKGKILGFNATSGNPEMAGDTSTVTTIFNAIGDNTLTLTGVITGGTLTTSGTVNFGSLSDGTITVTAFVDEDNMSSNSATLIPTQQSVKAYVDSQVTAQDLDATTDSGTIDIDLDSETLTIAGGEGIDTSATGTTITIAGEDASTSNKGVASFSSTFFSVSSGAVSLTAAQTGITSLLATDIKIGEDDQTKIDFETADTINFYAGNEKQLVLTDGALTPGTNAIIDLGTDALEFKDAYFDGTVEADAITIAGTALNEYIADTVGAMVSSNTETNITVTYEDGDNTLDFVIGTLNQDTTGTADNFTVTANNSANETVYPVFVDGATGSQGAETDTGLTYNPSTGLLTSTGFSGNLTGTLQTAAQANVTSVGTLSALTVSGLVTAHGGIDVDDFHLDGTALSLSSGNLSIDAGDNILLNTKQSSGSGGATYLKMGGTTYGGLLNSSGELVIQSGSTPTTALTFAGANATFAGTLGVGGALTANAGVVVDNITIDGTEIDLSSGTLTIDAASITLDASDSIGISTLGANNVKLGANAGNSIQSGGDQNVVIGDEAGTAITTGHNHVFIGYGAGDAVTTDETGLTAVGHNALTSNTSGTDNVAIGTSTLEDCTEGIGNVAVGRYAAADIIDADGNVAIGAYDGTVQPAMRLNTKSHDNVAIGAGALATHNLTDNSSGYNVAIGYAAGNAMTTGINNTLIGARVGDAFNTGGSNVGVGYEALSTDVKGSYSVAVGNYALLSQTFASATNVYNTGVGYAAGLNVTSGVQNTIIGALAGDALTDADFNVAVGHVALTTDTKGNRTTAVGYGALYAQNFTSSTDSNNTAVGYGAGTAVTSGQHNTLIGADSGDALTTGSQNVSVGRNSLSADTQGNKSVAVGEGSLYAQNFTSSTDAYNVAVGYDAGVSVTTGLYNTLVGGLAGDALTSGGYSTAVGKGALSTEDGHSNNTAVGYEALRDLNAGADGYNVAVGNIAGRELTTGVQNTLIGARSGDALTDADYNVAIGEQALATDTKGNKSTAIGQAALYYQNFTSSTDSHNTAVGYAAGLNVTIGTANTLVGSLAGDALTVGEDNVAIGLNAMGADDVGGRCVAIGSGALSTQNSPGANNNQMFNVAIGYAAGSAITDGYYNTCIGGIAGDGITTGNNCTIIGYDSNPSNNSTHAIALGSGVAVNSNDFTFGKSSNLVTNDFDSDADWSRSSDERLKKNITDQKLGLDFINDLRTVKYNWKPNGELDADDPQLAHLREEDKDGNIINHMNTTVTMHNFIAQEVKTALDKAGVSDFGGWKEDQWGVQQLSRAMFVIPLVKAVQELSAKVTSLEAEVTKLKGE